jgi:hypothetical protein
MPWAAEIGLDADGIDRLAGSGHPQATEVAESLAAVVGTAVPVHQLKVALSGRCWRRVIIALFGWDDDHLHVFTVGHRQYADPFHGLEETVPEHTMRLHQALPHPKATISHTYDLGACWQHEITLEKILDEHPLPRPECVAGKGGDPIEYYDPDDPEEPAPFDAAAINERLHKAAVQGGRHRARGGSKMDLAVKSEMVEQVRAFADWVGAGRKLTQTGRITLADARALVESLGTDDVIDPTIGDRVYRTTSSHELLHLTLVVEWAKAARLVRKTGNRLVLVKKNQALLDDPPTLWFTLFTTFEQLGEAFLPTGFGESLLSREFVTGIRAVLTSLYRTDSAVTTARLCATAWEVVTAPYDLGQATEFQRTHLHAANDRDTKRALDVLRRLGAVTIENDVVELTGLGRSGMRRLLGDPEPGDPVYQVKITLRGTAVWRRVLVPAAVRLDRLHTVVQATMGWQDAHLHVFVDDQTYYGVPDPELGFHDEHATRLNELVAPGGHLVYDYDFGDSWEHEILVEEATVAAPDARYPCCVAGESACPPEDVGGVPGYARLIDILADPGHEEHQDVLGWLGLDSRDQFDPARFDPDEANQRLADRLSPLR